MPDTYRKTLGLGRYNDALRFLANLWPDRPEAPKPSRTHSIVWDWNWLAALAGVPDADRQNVTLWRSVR